MLINPLRFSILICINDLTLFADSERVYVLRFTFCPLSDIFLDGLQISIFKDSNIAKHLSHPHDKYVVVPTSKAPNNIVFVRKSHYIESLIKKLGIDTSLGNPIYPPTTIIGLFCVTLRQMC
jgi:hypothetical protein